MDDTNQRQVIKENNSKRALRSLFLASTTLQARAPGLDVLMEVKLGDEEVQRT